MNRSEINRALAKALAHKACGQDREAEHWATKLIELLECSGILSERAIDAYSNVEQR